MPHAVLQSQYVVTRAYHRVVRVPTRKAREILLWGNFLSIEHCYDVKPGHSLGRWFERLGLKSDAMLEVESDTG